MKLRLVFPIEEKKHIIVHLESFDWDFSLGIVVELISGKHVLLARQAGSGNHEGNAVLELEPLESWDGIKEELKFFINSTDAKIEMKTPLE